MPRVRNKGGEQESRLSRRLPSAGFPSLLLMMVLPASSAFASDLNEFKAKRETVFEFAQKPVVTRKGDHVEIRFETKSLCDATVAVEDPSGRIVRHLVSGVLGPKAPPPFQKDSTTQVIVWDGKNDKGEYLDNKEQYTVRVSLGLRARFERSLYWSPYKRYGIVPVLAAAPEGVYVADGKGVDFVRLYDHDGRYVRTVYPFPHDQLEAVKGLNWYDFPQGYRLPRKGGLYQATLLTSGTNWHTGNYSIAQGGSAASGMAVQGQRLALAYVQVCRLATDGSSGGLDLHGPQTGIVIRSVADNDTDLDVGPASLAFSPDGKTLYLTGYLWRTGSWRQVPGALHAVYRIDYEGGSERTVFAGDPQRYGTDDRHFRVPTSVACDREGHVYVSDFLNDRVQVFDPKGTLLKTIRTPKPAKVCVHQKSGEVWVFSFEVVGVPDALYREFESATRKVSHTVARFSAFPEARELSREPFPLGVTDTLGFEFAGLLHQVELDSWAAEPTVWAAGRKHQVRGAELGFYGGAERWAQDTSVYEAGVTRTCRVDGQWKTIDSFGQRTVQEVGRAKPPEHNIQQLYVNPATGLLYVAEPDSGPTIKACKTWLEIDPDTGKIRPIELPFNALEAAFDVDGRVYLRNTDMVVRYAFPSFREIPWDYGLERERQGNDGGIHGRTAPVTAGLKMPTVSPVCYHQGGFNVSPRGDVVASCAYRYYGISAGFHFSRDAKRETAYQPKMFPGRVENSTSPCIHVWDERGKLKYEDVLPGAGQVDGVGIDRDDNVYLMHTPTRVLDGQPYFNEMSETLMRVPPKGARVVSSSGSPVPLPAENRPKRPPDLHSTRHGDAWVENADWFYGGVGFAGFNMRGHGGGCACWFARFALDLFARSIAPEPDQFRVALVDSAGNLILHIGQYGNVDDGVPLIPHSEFRDTHSIGGDEVALLHACFVGADTDRRVFIADYGNGRIVSVKLDYHATERIALKDVIDKANP